MSKRKNQNEDYGPPKKKSKVVSTVKIPKTIFVRSNFLIWLHKLVELLKLTGEEHNAFLESIGVDYNNRKQINETISQALPVKYQRQNVHCNL
jgi:hypothetical protein